VFSPVGTEDRAVAAFAERHGQVGADARIVRVRRHGSTQQGHAVPGPTQFDEGDPEMVLDRTVVGGCGQGAAQNELGMVEQVVPQPADPLVKLFADGVGEDGGHGRQTRPV
jgi:hypothetical protein